MFDPFFRDPTVVTDHVGRRIRQRNPDHTLKLYRRGSRYLKKYREFEILRYVSFYSEETRRGSTSLVYSLKLTWATQVNLANGHLHIALIFGNEA